MNHLAHALLADAGGNEFAIGSALGDFTRGRPDPAWPAARRAGLRFHRAIDAYTDHHPEVVAARHAFTPAFRRYAGIALDVWFDHLLVLGWNRYCDEPLAAFAGRWLALLDHRTEDLPARLLAFLGWMHVHGLPENYGDEATLDLVFRALARRLSRPSPLGDAMPALHALSGEIHQHFEAFYPDLAIRARQLRANLQA